MKKILLVSALGLVAASAMALTDVTPKNYVFNNATEFKYHENVFGTSNFAAPVWTTVQGDTYFNEGMVVLTGAVVGWGTSASVSKPIDETVDGPILKAGTALVDLGGEVGQVLAISGCKSKVNDRLKELFDVDMNVPVMPDVLHWFSMNFFADPNKLTKDGSDDYFNVRCRITCNFFYNFPNGPEDGVSLVNPFLVGNDGNIKTTDNAITTDKFVKFNEDGEPVDDEGEVSEDAYYWDPDKWMQFDLNFVVQPDEDGKCFSPVRLKYDIKADPLQNGTMFIKSVEFFVPTKDEAHNDSKPVIEMLTLKANPGEAGIEAIAADKASANVNINGRSVSFDGAATVYSITGATVAKAAAGQSVDLQAGAYVAKVNGKSVKFFVR